MWKRQQTLGRQRESPGREMESFITSSQVLSYQIPEYAAPAPQHGTGRYLLTLFCAIHTTACAPSNKFPRLYIQFHRRILNLFVSALNVYFLGESYSCKPSKASVSATTVIGPKCCPRNVDDNSLFNFCFASGSV